LAHSTLPFSQSCENNKVFIGERLQALFTDRRGVLEIASGTGQRAVFFARQLPALLWQPTEIPGNLPTLEPRCKLYKGSNVLPPKSLDVSVRHPLAGIGNAIR